MNKITQEDGKNNMNLINIFSKYEKQEPTLNERIETTQRANDKLILIIKKVSSLIFQTMVKHWETRKQTGYNSKRKWSVYFNFYRNFKRFMKDFGYE